MNSTEIKSLYNARKNIIYYLKQLKYDVSKYEVFNMTEVSAMYQASTTDVCELDIDVEKVNSNGTIEHCGIRHYIQSNLKQNALEQIVSEYYEEKTQEEKGNSNLIVIALTPMNDTIQKTVKSLWKKYREYVVILDLPLLQFNILQHKLVPEHIKLSMEEKNEMYQKFNIGDDSQIPEISIFDPVARVILLKPGQVCKIIRYDKISLQNEFYRICVV